LKFKQEIEDISIGLTVILYIALSLDLFILPNDKNNKTNRQKLKNIILLNSDRLKTA